MALKSNSRLPLCHFAEDLFQDEKTRWIAAILLLDCAILFRDIEASALLVIWLNETQDEIVGYTSIQRMNLLCLLEIQGSFCSTPHKECLWRFGLRLSFDQDRDSGIILVQLAADMGHQAAIEFLKKK